ncbi:MAG: hypothetical protein F6K40_12300 [Okeania sp. SIO3I5]|nr:hypothetical protein [Okeania sp. SIO3I5]NEQ37011.1 hypothetical protein [Okeania sp. SIO3I5]
MELSCHGDRLPIAVPWRILGIIRKILLTVKIAEHPIKHEVTSVSNI